MGTSDSLGEVVIEQPVSGSSSERVGGSSIGRLSAGEQVRLPSGKAVVSFSDCGRALELGVSPAELTLYVRSSSGVPDDGHLYVVSPACSGPESSSRLCVFRGLTVVTSSPEVPGPENIVLRQGEFQRIEVVTTTDRNAMPVLVIKWSDGAWTVRR